MTKADGKQHRNNQPTKGSEKSGIGGGGDSNSDGSGNNGDATARLQHNSNGDGQQWTVQQNETVMMAMKGVTAKQWCRNSNGTAKQRQRNGNGRDSNCDKWSNDNATGLAVMVGTMATASAINGKMGTGMEGVTATRQHKDDGWHNSYTMVTTAMDGATATAMDGARTTAMEGVPAMQRQQQQWKVQEQRRQ